MTEAETEHTAAAMDVCETDDREAAIPEFLEWLKQHGVKHPKIGFLRQGANNLSLLATDDIHVCATTHLSHTAHTHNGTFLSPLYQSGDDVVTVPLDELINVYLLRRLWPELADFDPTTIGADMHGLIYVFLATESKRPGSAYAPLFRMLPRPGTIGTPMSYSEERLGLLRGTNLYETVQKIKGRLRRLAEYYPTLQAEHAGLFAGLSCTYAELVWALEVFWSRAFGVLLDGEQVASLVPLCGMSNHSADAMVSYVTDTVRGCFCLRSDMEVAAGQQFYNNYRHRSNEKLLLNYGFVCENNPLDAFTVKVSLLPDDPLYTEKARLLAAHGIGWEHYLTLDKDCPIPDTLVDCLRILSLDETEVYFWDERAFGGVVSERNEVETLRVLAKLLARQYDKLVYKDIEGDLEKVRRLADEGTDYALYCIYSYRLGQAMILKHSMEFAQGMYDRALQAVRWKPQFIIGARCDGGLAAFNELAARTQVFRGVQYSEDDETGEIRLVATAPVRKGDVLISVPAAALVTPATVDALYKSPAFRDAAHTQDDFAVAAAVMLARPNLAGSEYLLAFYRCMPKEINSPVYLEPDQMEQLLAGTPLLPYAAEMRDQYRKEHDALTRALRALQPRRSARSAAGAAGTSGGLGAALAARPPLPWGVYAWARLMTEARLMDGEGGAPVFVPLPFLPRHSPYHKLDKHYDGAARAFVFRAACDVRAGQEIFDSAGSDQSFDHFLRGGFLLFQNPADFQDIALGSPVSDVDQANDTELTDMRLQALEQLHLLVNTQDAIDHYLQAHRFPDQLLDHMRVLAMTPDELRALLATSPPVTRLAPALAARTLALCAHTEAAAARSVLDIFASLQGDIAVLDEDAFANGVLPDEPLFRAVAAYVMRQKRIVDDAIATLADTAGDLLVQEKEEDDDEEGEEGEGEDAAPAASDGDGETSSANVSTAMEDGDEATDSHAAVKMCDTEDDENEKDKDNSSSTGDAAKRRCVEGCAAAAAASSSSEETTPESEAR